VNTRRFDKDRDERAKRVSLEMMGLERAAREAKTARLREARLAQEASAPKPEPVPEKAKRILSKRPAGRPPPG
jgi:hypothetical protein